MPGRHVSWSWSPQPSITAHTHICELRPTSYFCGWSWSPATAGCPWSWSPHLSSASGGPRHFRGRDDLRFRWTRNHTHAPSPCPRHPCRPSSTHASPACLAATYAGNFSSFLGHRRVPLVMVTPSISLRWPPALPRPR
jgi:hypothetical protein